MGRELKHPFRIVPGAINSLQSFKGSGAVVQCLDMEFIIAELERFADRTLACFECLVEHR